MPLGDSTYIPQDPKYFVDNNEMTNLSKYILRQLGWPLIRVEITPEQLIDSIIDAVQMYQDYAAYDYNVEIVNVVGHKAQIPSHIRPSMIANILYPRDYFDSFTSGLNMVGYEEALGGVIPYAVVGSHPLIDKFDMAEYYLYLQKLEDFKKIISVPRSYDILNKEIHLYPDGVIWTYVGIIYKPVLPESEAEQIQWIKQYSLAKAQMVVGRIRSKLGGFSSTGTNIAVDGEAMKTEAQAQIDKLEERLLTLGIPMPILKV